MKPNMIMEWVKDRMEGWKKSVEGANKVFLFRIENQLRSYQVIHIKLNKWSVKIYILVV